MKSIKTDKTLAGPINRKGEKTLNSSIRNEKGGITAHSVDKNNKGIWKTLKQQIWQLKQDKFPVKQHTKTDPRKKQECLIAFYLSYITK